MSPPSYEDGNGSRLQNIVFFRRLTISRNTAVHYSSAVFSLLTREATNGKNLVHVHSPSILIARSLRSISPSNALSREPEVETPKYQSPLFDMILNQFHPSHVLSVYPRPLSLSPILSCSIVVSNAQKERPGELDGPCAKMAAWELSVMQVWLAFPAPIAV
jgi:hypothetical protein